MLFVPCVNWDGSGGELMLIKTWTIIEEPLDWDDNVLKLDTVNTQILIKKCNSLDAVLGPLIRRYLKCNIAECPKFKIRVTINDVTKICLWHLCLESDPNGDTDLFKETKNAPSTAFYNAVKSIMSLVDEIGVVPHETITLTCDPKKKGVATFIYSNDKMVVDSVWRYIQKSADIGGIQLTIDGTKIDIPIFKIKNGRYEDDVNVTLNGEIDSIADSRRALSLQKKGVDGAAELCRCAYKPEHRDELALGFATKGRIEVIAKPMRRRIKVEHMPSEGYVIVSVVGSQNNLQEQGDLDLDPINDDE